MKAYPKVIQTDNDLLADLEAKGMSIADHDAASLALQKIGYYRLRGYFFHFMDQSSGKFIPDTNFDQVLTLYYFNCELSALLFSMSSKVEVALRARLCESLLPLGEPLAYLDPSLFKDKKTYWQNLGTLSNEIARSDEVFIVHNYDNHDGQIPLWAAVEIMSFGTLSKFIRNLAHGISSPVHHLAQFYSYTSPKGNSVVPSVDMLSSWIHAVVILRNMCAHNSRIYNRSMNKKPSILACDQQNPPPRFYGLYHFLLSMKYLRPDDDCWNEFVNHFDDLIRRYGTPINLSRLHLPADWKSHLIV